MKALIIYHKGYEGKILSQVKSILESKDVFYTAIDRELIHSSRYYKDKDLVIVIGGDGTFLRASRFNKNAPMLGINSNLKKKEGFFMQTNSANFSKKLNKAIDGKFDLIKLLRLEIKINGVKLKELALNEVFLGDSRPYNMFNYKLFVKGKREFQRSSGLLISTPAGSHAWLKSAQGAVMNLSANKYQFIARELYRGRITKNYKLKKGLMAKDQKIKIMCKSSGILAMDSLKPEYKLKREDKVEIFVSKYYLFYIKV